MDGAKFFGAANIETKTHISESGGAGRGRKRMEGGYREGGDGDGKWKRLQFLRKGWLWILGTHVSQVESENSTSVQGTPRRGNEHIAQGSALGGMRR